MAHGLLLPVPKTKQIMLPIVKEIQTAEKVVAQYVKAFNKMDVKPISFLIHPRFLFRYSSGFAAGGLRSEWRYLGYLYQTFALMKKEGLKVNAELAHMREPDSFAYPCVQLNPTHDRRIIFPNEECLIEKYRMRVPEKQVFLRTTIKDGKIFRVHCLLHPAEYNTLMKI